MPSSEKVGTSASGAATAGAMAVAIAVAKESGVGVRREVRVGVRPGLREDGGSTATQGRGCDRSCAEENRVVLLDVRRS